MKRSLLLACCVLFLLNVGFSQKVIPPQKSNVSLKKGIEPPSVSPVIQKPSAPITTQKGSSSVQRIWTVGNALYDFPNLQAAVELPVVASGDIIHLYEHMIKNGDPDLGVYINKSLEIVGKVPGETYTMVSASGTEGSSDRRSFVIEAGCKVVLSNLQLSRGYAKEHWGGAIFNSGELELNHCRVVSNRADQGGAGFIMQEPSPFREVLSITIRPFMEVELWPVNMQEPFWKELF